DAFYEPEGDRFLATELTRGPWDPGAQHAGPPAALLGYAIERLPDADRFQVGRLTFEILRSVPIAPVTVEARVARPGRRVQMVEAELAVEGEVLMRARGWRLAIDSVDLPPLQEPETPPAPPQEAHETDFFPTGEEHGYHSAMEVRFLHGGFVEAGPAKVWLRMRQPLVSGAPVTPLQRVLVTADVGNGVSAALDFRRYLFINVDLTVQLERMPAGEWICVDAVTLARPEGIGTAESVLLDGDGRIGRALQTLLVSER
ncbi:MAG TPA: thioesterase family protein, partial [Solirubrobacterales bacterium]|nr:thioesterase family protein [Solirubrobacterales bacterium]